MVWKEKTTKEMRVAPEYAELIKKSIYYNSEGELADASMRYRLEYIIIYSTMWLFVILIMNSLINLSKLSNATKNTTIIIIAIISYTVMMYYLYRWGWKNYSEAWYSFDHDDEIFTVVRKEKGQWEILEVPYEEIHEISYSDGPNGKAIIKAAEFEFHTNRANDKRDSSITEMWADLSHINTKMSSWPYYLECPVCKRRFGNHTGTATCPDDKDVILLDTEVKGRIDPESMNKQDLDRV